MAHEFTSGVFMHATPAWHGLGQVLEGTLPAEEAFRRAGALFPVEQLQLWAGDIKSQDLLNAVARAADREFSSPEERTAHIQEALEQQLVSMRENRVAIWRPDERKVLGTASPGYKIIPNQRLLDFASALREEVDMDTVVVLRGGAKVAFTAKIRGTDRQVVPGDKIYRNIVGYLGHDGSTAFGGMFTDIRVVCANTLGYAQGDANRHGRQFTIKHTENDVAQIDHIIGSIDIARQSFDQVVDEYQAMREVPMTTELYRHWLERVYQVPDVRLPDGDTRPGRIDDMPRKWAQLEKAWNYGLGRDIPGVAGTLYAGLNAITEVETSQLTQGAGKRRMHSTLFGTGGAVVKRANQLARELVTA
jgi:phage/plasmid-like protein (TIGR03299 family)